MWIGNVPANFATTGAAYYRAGHGIDLQVARALTDLGSFLQTISDGVIALLLVASATSIVAFQTFHRLFAWAAVALAASISGERIPQPPHRLQRAWEEADCCRLGGQHPVSGGSLR